MTIIAAAFRNADDYAIAADTLATDYGAKLDGFVKVWRLGPILLGYSGRWAQCCRLRDAIERALPTWSSPDLARLAEVVAEARTELLRHVGPPASGEVADTLVDLLTVGPWGICEFDSSGGVVHREAPGVAAIGSAMQVARGVMFALGRRAVYHEEDVDPAALVTEAVRAAIALDTGCGGEPVVLRGPG